MDLILNIAGAAGVALLGLWLFWSLFAICMQFYGLRLRHELDGVDMWLAGPWIALGLLFDVVFQHTVAVVYFLDLPDPGEYLVTQRLQRYQREVPDTWRGRWAKHICEKRLNKLDPRGRHC